jgi:hypothetical protein
VPDDWSKRRQSRRLRERAIRYAVNGWPVAPLAVPLDDHADPYLAGEVVSTGEAADAVWQEHPWDIALVARHFEVMELAPEYGAFLNHRLKSACPTAMAPAHRRWWFFLEPGSVNPDQLIATGGRLHRAWVAAPGSRLPSTGRIRWLVHPHQTRWLPHRRRDPIDEVLSS